MSSPVALCASSPGLSPGGCIWGFRSVVPHRPFPHRCRYCNCPPHSPPSPLSSPTPFRSISGGSLAAVASLQGGGVTDSSIRTLISFFATEHARLLTPASDESFALFLVSAGRLPFFVIALVPGCLLRHRLPPSLSSSGSVVLSRSGVSQRRDSVSGCLILASLERFSHLDRKSSFLRFVQYNCSNFLLMNGGTLSDIKSAGQKVGLIVWPAYSSQNSPLNIKSLSAGLERLCRKNISEVL